MTLNPFAERYNSYSIVQLLEIVQNKSDYELLAVEAAEAELASRQLTEKEIADANTDLEIKKQEKFKKEEKKKAIEDNIKSVGASIIDAVNPIQKTSPSNDKLIKLVCFVFGALFLYQFYNQFSFIVFMFTDSNARWSFGELLYFLPLILLPTATVLFWQKKKPGWTLFAIYLTFIVFTVFYSLIAELQRETLSIPALQNLFPNISPATYIGQILFYGGNLLFICRQQIRDIYTIDKQHMLVVVGTIVALTTFQWWELLTN